MSMKKIMSFFNKAFLAFVVLMQFSQAAYANQIRILTVDPEEIKLNPQGSCISEDDQEYEMKNLRHLSNQNIKMHVNDSEFILSISRDDLSIVEVGKENEGELIYNLKYSVSEEETLDIIVNFAELDHEDFVYWKESYLYKTYQQGLFKFDGDDLVFVCSGTGGITTSH